MGRFVSTVGVVLGLGSCLVVLTVACSCDEPSRPSMESCDRASAGAVVDALEIVRVEEIDGPQGGTHVEVEVRVTGSGLGRCIAQETALRRPSPDAPLVNESNVPLRGDDRVATTSPILLFPDLPPSRSDVPLTLVVRIGGREVERVLETRADAGL